MDAETAAVLGYLFAFPAWLVVVLGGEENEFVRFHVFQSALYNLVVGVGMVGLVVLWTGLVWVGSFVVFFLAIPVFALASAPSSGAGAGGAVSALFVVVASVLVVGFVGLLVLLVVLPLVISAAVLGYLLYIVYRVSSGDWYRMPYIADLVEGYV